MTRIFGSRRPLKEGERRLLLSSYGCWPRCATSASRALAERPTRNLPTAGHRPVVRSPVTTTLAAIAAAALAAALSTATFPSATDRLH